MSRRQTALLVEQLVAELRREQASLGMFQRQWYRQMIKARTGLSLEDWEAVGDELYQLACKPAAPAIAFSAHAAWLKVLAGYFGRLEAEARDSIKNPGQLLQVVTTLQRRRLAAEGAAAALVQQ